MLATIGVLLICVFASCSATVAYVATERAFRAIREEMRRGR